MIVFDGFEILEWIVLAFMILVFIVAMTVLWLKEKFEIWKDKRRKR